MEQEYGFCKSLLLKGLQSDKNCHSVSRKPINSIKPTEVIRFTCLKRYISMNILWKYLPYISEESIRYTKFIHILSREKIKQPLLTFTLNGEETLLDGLARYKVAERLKLKKIPVESLGDIPEKEAVFKRILLNKQRLVNKFEWKYAITCYADIAPKDSFEKFLKDLDEEKVVYANNLKHCSTMEQAAFVISLLPFTSIPIDNLLKGGPEKFSESEAVKNITLTYKKRKYINDDRSINIQAS